MYFFRSILLISALLSIVFVNISFAKTQLCYEIEIPSHIVKTYLRDTRVDLFDRIDYLFKNERTNCLLFELFKISGGVGNTSK